MKQEDTKRRILEKALELFSARGYDSVSVGEIAQAVGIKAPSLYNHFPGKRAIFDAIVEATAAQYERDTDRIDIHVQNAERDIPVFAEITADGLFEKVRQIFDYSLHNETIRRFRRMMTIEQFRSPELALLYVAPVLTLIGICDRQPEREGECLRKLREHVELFFRMTHPADGRKEGEP